MPSSELREILDNTVFRMGPGPNGARGDFFYSEEKIPLEQAILTWALKAVGEDERELPDTAGFAEKSWNIGVRAQNILRADIRKRLQA